VIFTFFSLSFSQGLSSLNDTIDASTCVAPKEYQICYDIAVLTSTKCVEDAGDAIQVLGCGCADFQEQITCILNACWNRVRTSKLLSDAWLILGDRSMDASIKSW
jgi:hypothetical protein